MSKDRWAGKLFHYQKLENEKRERFLEIVHKKPDDYPLFSEIREAQKGIAHALGLTFREYKKKLKDKNGKEILSIAYENWRNGDMITWEEAVAIQKTIDETWDHNIHQVGAIMEKRFKSLKDEKFLGKLDAPRKRRKGMKADDPRNIARLKTSLAKKDTRRQKTIDREVLGGLVETLYQQLFEEEMAEQTSATPVDELPSDFWDK